MTQLSKFGRACPEVAVETALLQARGLAAQLATLDLGAHAMDGHRVRIARAHALALVDLLEESVLEGV